MRTAKRCSAWRTPVISLGSPNERREDVFAWWMARLCSITRCLSFGGARRPSTKYVASARAELRLQQSSPDRVPYHPGDATHVQPLLDPSLVKLNGFRGNGKPSSYFFVGKSSQVIQSIVCIASTDQVSHDRARQQVLVARPLRFLACSGRRCYSCKLSWTIRI